MSGPFGSSQWMYSSGFYPYAIDNSLRFNDDDSAYLSRTPASAGNQKTWTWSGWVKRGNLGSYQNFTRASGTLFRFTNSDTIQMEHNGTSVITSAVFRDVSAWYHVVLSMDTTQATSSDRTKIYVNGVQQSVTGSYLAQNTDTYINSVTSHSIGASVVPNEFLDGYLADVHFIDGTALDASSFGETKSGIWVAKSYSGSYGTNGFHLKFDGNVNDSSNNGNNWTANNISSHDYVPDSPVTNWCALNALTYSGAYALTLSQGNLNAREATGNATWKSRWSTFAAPTSGKWYAEFYLTYIGTTAFTNQAFVGLHDGLAATTYIGQSSGSYGYIASGGTYNNATHTTPYGASYGSGDIIGVAWDADNGDITFYKNGVSQGIAYSSVSAENKFFGVSALWVYPDGQTYWHCNFGQDSTFAGATTAGGNSDANGVGDFKYAPPSGGYLALCASNLSAPAIDPAVDASPTDHFNTVLYTGTGTTDQAVTGVGFQPDFTWIKSRSNAYAHWLNDSVRGAGKGLRSDATDAEYTTLPIFLSFDTDGFTVDVDTATANNTTNGSGSTFAAWNWKAGGTAVSNTDGSITSQVSANPDAGFSIVSYTGNGTSGATVGHGLTTAPSLFIVKSRDTTSGGLTNWRIFHTSLGATKNLVFTTLAALTATNIWNDTAPTASVFSIGNHVSVNDNTKNYIAYCFAEIDGFSKVGSYTGNGSTDGPFVYTGFRPAWVMIKASSAAGYSWNLIDTARDTYNTQGLYLFANTSGAEGSGSYVDILSNGFKPRNLGAGVNGSGITYIYLAFAEQPFKYSNAR